MNDPRMPIVQTAASASASSSEIDWRKILGVGAVVVVGGAVLYYLLGGSERRSSLKEAEQKFDEASAKKEEEDWEAAEKLYLESLTILRRHLDKNDENIAEIYRELAACALNKMELDKAETYSRDCLRIKEHIHGSESPLICESLVNLAGILAALKAGDALEHAQKARSIYEIPPEDKRDYAGLSHALRTIAAIMMTHADLAKAQEAAILSIEYMDKVGYTPETKHDYYRDAMEGQILLAKIYIKQENIEAAETIYKDLVQKARDVLGVDVFVAYALRNLGDFYADRGLLDQAEVAYKQAVEEVQQRNGSDNSTVIAFINYLAHFYWDHQRDADAREVFETLRSMNSLPSPTNSRCLVTRLFAFTFVRAKDDAHLIEPVYVGELLPTNKLPTEAYLEVFYENPQDPSNPIKQERQLTHEDKDAIVLLSPPVKGVTRRMYEIAIHIYSDASKSTKLGEHHQMCQSVFETDQIRTEEDLMKQIPKDRII
jgi:tetratricopeptide (TPR) repeat protein